MAEDDRFYVETLRMQNFRCFEDVELGPFDPHFNLLVGENGAGKSSVLVALAGLFSDIGNSFGRIIGPERIISSSDQRNSLRKSANHDSGENLNTIASYHWLGENREIWLKASRFEPESTNLAPLNISDFASALFPMLLFFRASRRFLRSISPTGDSEPSQNVQRGDAFRNWSRAGASIDDLLTWTRDETLVEFELAREAGTVFWKNDKSALATVRKACKLAIEGADDLFYNGTSKDIIVSFDDGRKLALSSMSDGQRALVGLVAEIARRAHILNGSNLDADVLEQTPGLVLIDEIDLHLHPKWQRQIVPALKNVFPRIQFFATTHSPQVIGECKPEEIVLLTPQGQKRPSGGYGRDSNWILECVMDAEGRDPKIAAQLKALFDDIEDEKFDEARAKIRELRSKIGEGPDIVGAEAYLWRMEHLGDEAAE